jgi:Kef-type K+ transport system membrane component KefB/mannitol/fructose-specific phosphotransferase system IIA component (Ntr-type)
MLLVARHPPARSPLTSLLENNLIALALLTTCGLLAGEAAKRLRLPAVTGQILAGVLIGPSVLGLLDHHTSEAMTPVINFALGLIALAVGSHLHIYRLENALRRLGWLLLLEMILTPVLVYAAVRFLGDGDWVFGILLGTLAISTAPATVVAIVKETRARGVFVSTLMAAVALNNIACIMLFEMAYTAVRVGTMDGGSVGSIFLAPFEELGLSILVGGAVGVVMALTTRHVFQAEKLATTSLIGLFLTIGLADAVGVSELLSCLFMGATLANLAHDKEEIGHRAFASFEPAILAIFFTLAGMELHLASLGSAGLLALLVITARMAGKVASGWLAMKLAGAPRSLGDNLGLALIPQAGVAVGLLLKVKDSPLLETVGSFFVVVGVATVALNEIIGPLTTRWALARSGDLGMDRPRLIDFLHEPNIVTGFRAADKEEAIARLVDLLVRSHGLTQVDRRELVDQILERERAMSTCVGRGLFLPHAELAGVTQLVGVMAINREGLGFDTPDGQPVHCITLLVVPPEQRQRHLEVLAALARSVGSDPAIQTQLYHASTPAHVHEILHAEDFEDYNYFLEEDQV